MNMGMMGRGGPMTGPMGGLMPGMIGLGMPGGMGPGGPLLVAAAAQPNTHLFQDVADLSRPSSQSLSTVCVAKPVMATSGASASQSTVVLI